MRTREETLAKRDAEALRIMDAEIAARTDFHIDERTGEPNARAELVLHAGGWDVGDFVAALTRASNERFIVLGMTGFMPGAASVAVQADKIYGRARAGSSKHDYLSDFGGSR